MNRPESVLSADDVVILTGRKVKSHQCEALRAMGIPFAVNLVGYPLVPRSAIDGSAARGRQEAKELQQKLDDALQRAQEENARDALIRRKQRRRRYAVGTRAAPQYLQRHASMCTRPRPA